MVQFVLELLRQHRISDATFEAIRALVGNEGVVDVLVVSGYYHTLAHCLQALDVDLPEGTETALTLLNLLPPARPDAELLAPQVVPLSCFRSPEL